MGEKKDIKSIPILPFSLNISLISAIIILIAGIINAIIGTAIIGSIISVLPQNATAAISTLQAFGTAASISFIIIWPIMTFIGVFIVMAIAAALYNFLAPRIGPIKLEIE